MQPKIIRMKNRKPEKRNYMEPRKQQAMSTNANYIRLNRVLANAGICSRREADDLIKAGLVEVNGKVCLEMGTKVGVDDVVKYAGEKVRREQYRYILVNKPKNVVMGAPKNKGQQSIFEIIKGACKESVAPVGKLHKDTTGLVLLTNDQDVEFKLNKAKVKSTFKVECTDIVRFSHLHEFMQGVKTKEGINIKTSEAFFPDKNDHKIVLLTLNSSKPQTVKELFAHFGYIVKSMDRVSLAGLAKGDLNRGKWRFLTDKEIGFLKMLS